MTGVLEPLDKTVCIPVSWKRKSMKEQGHIKMGWFTEYLVFVGLTLGGLAWWWYGSPRKRVTSLFLIHRHKIWQSVNHEGRVAMRVQRQQYEGKPLQVKLFGLAKFLRLQMQQLLQALPYEVQFKTRTHLKRSFEKAQQQREITIHSIKKKENRLLIESIALLGLKDFLKVLFSPDAKLLFKQFYTITFTRNK